jgi:hypothetical protein
VEELCVQCFSPNIIQTIKSRRTRFAGFVPHKAEKRGAYRIFGGEIQVKVTASKI